MAALGFVIAARAFCTFAPGKLLVLGSLRANGAGRVSAFTTGMDASIRLISSIISRMWFDIDFLLVWFDESSDGQAEDDFELSLFLTKGEPSRANVRERLG